MESKIDWSKAPEGATHYFPPTEVWYLAGNGCAPLVWNGMWCKAFQFSQREHKCVQRPTTPSWSGEGLPPVGVVCMANGYQVVIVAHHCNGIHAIYAESEYDGLLYYGEPNEFRPIRTPEQIASGEREEAVNGMLCYDALGGSRRGLAEALYDAGYRKEQK